MKINRDKILDALRTLKDVCTLQGSEEMCCYHCPLSDGTVCMVIEHGAPETWALNEPEKDWRAFKND